MNLGMPDTTPSIKILKPQESRASQSKLILVKKILQDINKQMLETKYFMNLGQLLKLVPKLKRYVWQKVKQNKPQSVQKTITKKKQYVVPKVTTTITTDNNMAIIQVQIGKIIV